MRDRGGFDPPVDLWSQQAAEIALRSLVRDRTIIGADEAWRRLQRLTAAQRDWVISRVQLWELVADQPADRVPTPTRDAVLIVAGDRINPGEDAHDVELWCVPFEGWGAVHHLHASHWVVPRRFAVVGDALIQASGLTDASLVLPGEAFDIQVQRPPR
ncbi:hypothetical protein [Miltoncostaea oceani]|uniref:hypothetical protein n=1 Tax=Miltoncostaea oceani TaxID=2843216 RepID=UPI001C3D1F9E|nr:hypothetical protein [Miltoncostaea oceani]